MPSKYRPSSDFNTDTEAELDSTTVGTSPGVASTAVPSSPVMDLKSESSLYFEPTNMSKSSRSTPVTMEAVTSEEDLEHKLLKLNQLLERSSMYTNILGERMKLALPPVQSGEPDDKGNKKRFPSKGGERNVKRRKLNDDDNAPSVLKPDSTSQSAFKQPEAITGAILKDYQLIGVQWLTTLFLNGINGILADEMGLGTCLKCLHPTFYSSKLAKTLQTIAFLAHIPHTRPALVVCPLSVLHNWADEFTKFAPSIPTCVYHGTPAERAELRQTRLTPKFMQSFSQKSVGKPSPDAKTKKGKSTKKSNTGKSNPRKAAPRRSTKRSTKVESEESDSSDSESESEANHSNTPDTNIYPNNIVVITTYEMIIRDRQHLAKYQWNYIVVDEGHRLKNMDCKLIREIKKYDSANRLILTGTPLQNNLTELWSLLNFILPDIFTDLDSFQEWFNISTAENALPTEQSAHIISKLHDILKPFLLRRLKADVDSLPPKKEYVLYAPLSERQRAVYDAILNGALRQFLIKGKQEKEKEALEEVLKGGRGKRIRKKVNYKIDEEQNEEDWLEEASRKRETEKGHEDELNAGRSYLYHNTVKQVNSMKLQNTVMQLRKVCSHPFLFDWPTDPKTMESVVNDELVNASGKMMILDRLLCELFRRGHKVLLFSQFTTMLDIIEEWAHSFKSWQTCRIDGSTSPMERRAEMNKFQNSGDSPDAPKLFLLSTRAGGLGITLTAADTVVFYDQDWNPQMDIQAQDRAHRIGQTKPVLIFRLVSAHTVETKIMQKANEKRQLEALVIAKGKFRMPGSSQRPKTESIAEMAASLLKLEGEKIEVVPHSEAGKAKVISDADLERLLDRSPEVFVDRKKGWHSGIKEGRKAKEGGDVVFEVFEAPADQCNDSLAAVMGEALAE
ncbi:hypothetical protein Clacol_008472 [Clathrus columnatus]|uniref:Lymphoid-specific helicase n=1 Tax=Clathrus columnatus TaxID=1419009 RepID=A0AAV5AN02_9AGAM|nr:hypothetical protein Clacol_008472 [Clathrus columnatus]